VLVASLTIRAQHEADQTDVATREVLVVFDIAPAAPEPTIRAPNDPALG
jgi:hypothetical protein